MSPGTNAPMSTFVITDSDPAGEPDFANVCGVFWMSRLGDDAVGGRCPDDERAVAGLDRSVSRGAR